MEEENKEVQVTQTEAAPQAQAPAATVETTPAPEVAVTQQAEEKPVEAAPPAAPEVKVEANTTQVAPAQQVTTEQAAPVQAAPAQAAPVQQATVQAAPAATAPAPATVPQTQATTVVPETAPAAVAPTPPSGEDIKETPALNPIANNPQPVATAAAPQAEAKPTTATIAPSTSIGDSFDSNVGFVAVGENLKKKKNVPLRIFIVLIILGALGTLGYFVGMPFLIKTITKPEQVYSQVIDTVFKDVDTYIDMFVRNKTIIDADLEIDTNVEDIKELSGLRYSFSLGADAENQDIQKGIKIIDSSNQEHSAFIYVKGDRQYIRLSSYRDLIFMGNSDNDKESNDKIYNLFTNFNNEDYKYVVHKYIELLKSSIVVNKLSKEDASITVNGKTMKVLNSKYTIDNDTLVSMYKTIYDGFANDEKAIDIIARNKGITKEEAKKLFAFDSSQPLIEDGKVYYFHIYTYSIKNVFIGCELIEGDIATHFYTKDGFFEIRKTGIETDEETGKEINIDWKAVGKKEDGKTVITVTELNNDNGQSVETGRYIVSAFDKNNIDFTYDTVLPDQRVSGEVRIKIDSNDNRTKVNSYITVNSGKDFLRVSLDITDDWTSDVANINVGTAVEMETYELNAKVQEFISTLENTPLYLMFTTVSGDYDESLVNIDDFIKIK